MRYLITFTDGSEPFLTPYFDSENLYIATMIVFDLDSQTYTTDGQIWNEIIEDHL